MPSLRRSKGARRDPYHHIGLLACVTQCPSLVIVRHTSRLLACSLVSCWLLSLLVSLNAYCVTSVHWWRCPLAIDTTYANPLHSYHLSSEVMEMDRHEERMIRKEIAIRLQRQAADTSWLRTSETRSDIERQVRWEIGQGGWWLVGIQQSIRAARMAF